DVEENLISPLAKTITGWLIKDTAPIRRQMNAFDKTMQAINSGIGMNLKDREKFPAKIANFASKAGRNAASHFIVGVAANIMIDVLLFCFGYMSWRELISSVWRNIQEKANEAILVGILSCLLPGWGSVIYAVCRLIVEVLGPFWDRS
ncbi:hypothetical protein FRC17_000050, partial [Serendipita sp. 399]